MDQSIFVTYQKFTIREEALALGDLMKQKYIPFKLEVGAEDFDPSFVFKDEFRILIRPEDFDKVSSLFTENVEEDYYLFSFNDEELMEIIEKYDEWSHFDFVLAQKILKERGKTVDTEIVQQARNKRIVKVEPVSANQNKKPLLVIIVSIICFLISLILSVWESIQIRLH